MMAQPNHDPGTFFYSFRLDEAAPDDHPVRAMLRFSNLSGTRTASAFYPNIGRPSIDPVLMSRKVIDGDDLRSDWSERCVATCEEPCLSLVLAALVEDKEPDHSRSRIRRAAPWARYVPPGFRA